MCTYLTQDPSQKYVVAADNISMTGQREMLNRLTDRKLQNRDRLSSDDNDDDLEERKTTVCGRKYDFRKKDEEKM